MGKRGRYEFSDGVKRSAKKEWHRNNPGNPKEPLEIDHIVPVHFAKRHGIPPDLVRTRDNARALRIKEHKERHRNEPTEEEYMTLSQGLLGWIKNLF